MPPHGFQFAGGMSFRRVWQGENTMAIVRSREGSFFDVPDEELKKYEKKAEDVQGRSAEACGDQGQGQGGPGAGPGGPGGPGGGGASPIQIIVNYAGGMGGGQGAPSGGGSGDVKGRYCGHWHNCWRNCWRNYWRNFCW